MLGGHKSIANGLAFAGMPHGTGVAEGAGSDGATPKPEPPQKMPKSKKALTAVKVVSQKIRLIDLHETD